MTKRVGRYEIIQPIASGGMATVYLGRARGADFEGFERLVAVKAMHPHIANSSDYLAMFFDEATLAARIRHPNVVATLDIVREAGSPLIVMELVEGPSLHRLLRIMQKTDQRLPLDIALRIMIDVLAGLHAAHELSSEDGKPLNLVHRDVSPQNVLIGCDGVVRLTDFGVAHAEERLARTQTGQLKGKIQYLSPEQVRGQSVDRRADVYAAGALFWEMLAGQRLLEGKHEAELIYKLLEGAERAPSALNAAVPPPVDAACMKALSPEPGDRFATAADFAEALEDAAAAAGAAIATARKLAAFVDGLAAHDPAPAGKGPRWIRPSEQVALHAGSGDAGDSGAPVIRPAAGAPPAETDALPRTLPDQPTTPTVPLDASSLRGDAPPEATPPSPPRVDEPSPFAGTPLTHDNPLIASLMPPPKRDVKTPLWVAGAALLVVSLAVVLGTSGDDAPSASPPPTAEPAAPEVEVEAAAAAAIASDTAGVPEAPAPSAAPSASAAAEPVTRTATSAPRPLPVPPPVPRRPAPSPRPAASGKRYHPGGL